MITIIFAIFISSFSISAAATGNRKVDWLINEGLITGYPDGSYGLNNTITRAEVSTILTRFLEREDVSEVLKTVQGKFIDVLPSHWANGYINFANSMGYVNGYPDYSFRPGNNITYAEMIKILVMINGGIQNAADYQGESWATPYIIKAIESGIMNGIVIPDEGYSSYASRGNVFEMIYNTKMINYLQNKEDYNVIIIGNSRTSNVEANEVLVQVIEIGDQFTNIKYNYAPGDKVIIKLDTFYDSEDLLGKIVKLSLDKEGSVVDIRIDNSFDYYIGPFMANEDSVMINTGEVFDVFYGSKAARDSEKLYQMYHNDKEYDYLAFIDQFDELDGKVDYSYVSEFARITIKGRNVYFIDAYDFDDIAPVASVGDNGRAITVYDDIGNALLKRVYLKSVYGLYGDKFENIELKDILVEDVIHIYGNKAIVKMDAAYSGQYKGIDDSSEVVYALINKQYFQVRNTDNKKPVYSLDGLLFNTLNDYEVYELLESLENRRVVFLIDLNQSLQLISQYY